jgi:hypothetical protein
MEAPERGALMLVRFVAAAMMGWTVVDLALYWVLSQHDHTALGFLPCLLKSIPFVFGVVLLIKAKTVAQWISNLLDE